MLVSKKYSLHDVITFKLTSGEEVLARYVSETDDNIVLNKPMVLVGTPTSLGMMPAAISLNPTDFVTLNKHAVALCGPCQTDLANQYIEKTTGIAIAKSGLI
jgi:hypothetical protein